MDILPREILIEIFHYCVRKDLLNLTLTCKTFNNVISSNSKLMDMLYIDIKRNHPDIEWNPSRKYTQLMIHKNHSELPKIIEYIKNDLTLLRLFYIPMKISDLKKILFVCPKLKKLEMIDADFSFDEKSLEEPLPQLEFDSIACCVNRNVLRMLRYCQTKHYTSYRVKTEPGEFEALREFLKTQKKLENLELMSFHWDYEIFAEDTLNEVDFRLKTLTIRDVTTFDFENFIKFLKNHRESLQKIDIMNFRRSRNPLFHGELLNTAAEFRNLKNLSLSCFNAEFKPMPYVEKLQAYDIGPIWSERFPNVRHLSAVSSKNPSDFAKFTKLETLRIEGLENFDQFKIPLTVKTLYLSEIRMKEGVRHPFDYSAHQIESLTVDECNDADWLGDFLRSLKEKLKFLRIERNFLSRHRRFARLFEKEPELRNKAERFVFIDYKDEFDEKSLPSDYEESESEDEYLYLYWKRQRFNPSDDSCW